MGINSNKHIKALYGKIEEVWLLILVTRRARRAGRILQVAVKEDK